VKGRLKTERLMEPGTDNLIELRRRAEANLSRIVSRTVPTLAPENVEALVHELRVHQIELELQCQELQRAQHETEESRDRYRELYESIPLGYATIDAAGRLYDMNPAGAALLGVEREGGLLRNFFFFFFDDDADAMILLARKVIERQEPDCCESIMKRADGRPFSAFLQAAPVQVGEGKGERSRIAFKDISRRKEAEAALRRYQLELEANRTELRELAGKLFTAQEEERRRIACELHDDYCQRITAVILEVGSVSKSCQALAPSLVPRMDVMREKLVEILDEFRQLSHELHPRNLDTLSLASCMRTLVQEVADYGRLQIEFEERNVPARLPMPIVIGLYRLLQESLSNIRKHANATCARVRLSGDSDGVTLSISDDGTGFETGRTADRKKGVGLTSMQERVRPLGGHVSIESRPGQGTTITATIPLSR